jgi:hypothetical protein
MITFGCLFCAVEASGVGFPAYLPVMAQKLAPVMSA